MSKYKNGSVFFLYPNDSINNKTRVVGKLESYELSVLYWSESYYKNRILLKEKAEREVLQQNDKEKSRLNKVLDEI